MINANQKITISVIDHYCEELENSRRIGYDKHLKLSDYKEIYDDKSWHVIATHNNEIISTIRVTPYPLSPIHDWTNNTVPLPLNKEVVNVTKGYTVPEFRKTGIFKLIFSTVCLFSKYKGYKFAIGAYETSIDSKKSTTRLGFEEVGTDIEFSIPPYIKIIVKPIICDLDAKFEMYRNEQKLAIKQVESNEYLVEMKVDL